MFSLLNFRCPLSPYLMWSACGIRGVFLSSLLQALQGLPAEDEELLFLIAFGLCSVDIANAVAVLISPLEWYSVFFSLTLFSLILLNTEKDTCGACILLCLLLFLLKKVSCFCLLDLIFPLGVEEDCVVCSMTAMWNGL